MEEWGGGGRERKKGKRSGGNEGEDGVEELLRM